MFSSVSRALPRAQAETLRGSLGNSRGVASFRRWSQSHLDYYIDPFANRTAAGRKNTGEPCVIIDKVGRSRREVHRFRQTPYTSSAAGQTPYEDLHSYTSPSFSGPAGQKSRVHTAAPKYDDLDLYKNTSYPSTTAREQSAAPYEDLHHYGRPSADVAAKQYDAEHSYKDLSKYEPYHVESSSLPVDNSNARYADISDYRPDIPVETPVSFVGEQTEPAVDLASLLNVGPTSNVQPINEEYTDLPAYEPSAYDSPLKQRPLSAEEKSKLYTDLNKYDDPAAFNERLGGQLPPSEESLSKNYKDLDHYVPPEFDDPHVAHVLTAEEKSKHYQDLNQYAPTKFDSPHAPRSLTAEEKSKNYKDLSDYDGPVTYNEKQNQPLGEPSKNSRALLEALAHAETLKSRRLGGIPTDYARLDDYRQPYHDAPTSTIRMPNAYSHLHTLALDHTLDPASAPPTVDPVSAALSEYDSKHGISTLNLKSLPINGLGPKVTRRSMSTAAPRPVYDPSYVDPNWMTPAQYRILSYNPSTKTMRETVASRVEHEVRPLRGLDDVISNIAEPTRFYPHFTRLASEGFEVSQGKGNVLVFRKVQDDDFFARLPPPPPADPYFVQKLLAKAAVFVGTVAAGMTLASSTGSVV